MTNNKIQEILNDLYTLDPSLRSEEVMLVDLIDKLISARPNLEINEKFMTELKNELMAQVCETKKSPAFSWALKLSYAVSGAALMLLLAPLSYLALSHQGSNINDSKSLVNQTSDKLSLRQAAFNVRQIGSNAFGKLSQVNQISSSQENITKTSSNGGRSVAMLDSQANSAVSTKMIAPAGMGGGTSSIMPIMTSYKFIYKGDGIKPEATAVSVMKRIKNISLDGASSILDQAGLGMINLNSFSNLKIQNISLAEDKEYGLLANINTDDGSISVGQNWVKWQNTAINKCRDEKCFNDLRLKLSDVPSDQDLIAIADSFVNETGINKENLGQGEVDGRWRDDYERVADKQMAYIPDSMTVLYPLNLGGKDVYDEWGNKIGVSVNIDIREKKVSGVWGLSPQNYEASDYEAQTDKAEVERLLARGGMYQNYYYGTGETKTTELEVGDPQIVLARIYRYVNNVNEELFVPAMLFPVKNIPKEGYFNQKNIIVPLAKDFYTPDENGGGIMPMMKDGVSGSAGSAVTEPATVSEPAVDVAPMKR